MIFNVLQIVNTRYYQPFIFSTENSPLR